eukprot:Filipodium_phascolosomae@DN1961_c0_g1_i4.p1
MKRKIAPKQPCQRIDAEATYDCTGEASGSSCVSGASSSDCRSNPTNRSSREVYTYKMKCSSTQPHSEQDSSSSSVSDEAHHLRMVSAHSQDCRTEIESVRTSGTGGDKINSSTIKQGSRSRNINSQKGDGSKRSVWSSSNRRGVSVPPGRTAPLGTTSVPPVAHATVTTLEKPYPDTACLAAYNEKMPLGRRFRSKSPRDDGCEPRVEGIAKSDTPITSNLLALQTPANTTGNSCRRRFGYGRITGKGSRHRNDNDADTLKYGLGLPVVRCNSEKSGGTDSKDNCCGAAVTALPLIEAAVLLRQLLERVRRREAMTSKQAPSSPAAAPLVSQIETVLFSIEHHCHAPPTNTKSSGNVSPITSPGLQPERDLGVVAQSFPLPTTTAVAIHADAGLAGSYYTLTSKHQQRSPPIRKPGGGASTTAPTYSSSCSKGWSGTTTPVGYPKSRSNCAAKENNCRMATKSWGSLRAIQRGSEASVRSGGDRMAYRDSSSHPKEMETPFPPTLQGLNSSS